MYKLKLCLRYLVTRILLAFTVFCIMIGVAVMVIVNGVMAGFSHEMRDRMHGVMADVTLESWSANGFPDAKSHMERIQKVCDEKIGEGVIESMTPLCQSQGLVSFQLGQEWIHLPVFVIGIDPNGEDETKDFCQYFQHPLNREKLSFELREDGYEQSSDPQHPRMALKDAGWKYRRNLPPPIEIIREPIVNPAAELDKVRASQPLPAQQPSNQENSAPSVPETPATDNSQPGEADSMPPLAELPALSEDDLPEKEQNLPPIPDIPSYPAVQDSGASGSPDSIAPKEQTPVAQTEQQDELKEFPSPHDSNDPEAVKNISGRNSVRHQTNYTPASEAQAGNPADGTLDLPELPSDPHAENEAWEREQNQAGSSAPAQTGGAESTVENNPGSAPQTDASVSADSDDPFSLRKEDKPVTFDPRLKQHTGLIMGISLASTRMADGEEKFYCWPGKDVQLTMADTKLPPRGITDNFTVVDIYESKMSEFDSMFVFIPLDKMQDMRAMKDPFSGVRSVNSIRIKLKDEKNGPLVRDTLKEEFNSPDREFYKIQTWQDQRSNLLAAVEMERSVMNVLLFLIIAVCGFSIMTIFLMIVSEKIKDIGILRALGASAPGIMFVFLNYGLLLGIVGSFLGVIGGLVFLYYINPIADFLSLITGRPVFPPDIYYFYKIPTCVEWQTIVWIVIGTIFVTVLASVFPAWRAASMQPVETLRS